MIYERPPRSGCCGPDPLHRLAEILQDCPLILVEAAGKQPKQFLVNMSIPFWECNGHIADIVASISWRDIARYRPAITKPIAAWHWGLRLKNDCPCLSRERRHVIMPPIFFGLYPCTQRNVSESRAKSIFLE
jgi:hypothetical protein